eukprot:TRINITY_DN1616_c0_g1_i1.p2 TRINITY_DN1616_c0_g1~~TRINITY_DN1616_c0_g1_i1.p2  ORF type:complete len:133 (+),score=23.16 TRINITY_DN1616_c0_g1_i1:835-1233(+)
MPALCTMRVAQSLSNHSSSSQHPQHQQMAMVARYTKGDLKAARDVNIDGQRLMLASSQAAIARRMMSLQLQAPRSRVWEPQHSKARPQRESTKVQDTLEASTCVRHHLLHALRTMRDQEAAARSGPEINASK